jgi:proton-translocating NAD(P)+ transhydrogenase subunit alpha
MKIAFPRESNIKETRVVLIPKTIEKYLKLKAKVFIEKDYGKTLNISDKEYENAGAIVLDRIELLKNADIILRIGMIPEEEIASLKKNSIHISFLDPFREKKLIHNLSDANATAISLEMIPRTTIAQKMDALSSQANLAGYVAVITAASMSYKVLPMMTTPAGTISPIKVFVIGAGVAGLQAIATAKRLGAKVDAFDTRAVVEEQVKSLGARFVKIDLGETGQTKDGYAKALTDDQIKLQRAAMQKICADSDIVITTAQLFGRKAPIVITKEMVNSMKSGSVIIDMAVESGGNVEGSKINETVEVNGVKIVGLLNLPGKVAYNASQMLSANLYNFIQHFWDPEKNIFQVNLEDTLLKGCVITHGGQIQNQMIKDFYAKG